MLCYTFCGVFVSSMFSSAVYVFFLMSVDTINIRIIKWMDDLKEAHFLFYPTHNHFLSHDVSFKDTFLCTIFYLNSTFYNYAFIIT